MHEKFQKKKFFIYVNLWFGGVLQNMFWKTLENTLKSAYARVSF